MDMLKMVTHQSSDVRSTTSTRTPSCNGRSPGSYINACSATKHSRTTNFPLTSLEYSYSASAHSPLSCCVALRGRAGGGPGDGVGAGEGVDAPVDGTRLGGGAKSFLRWNAGGVGGATCGGGALFIAVEFRIDENMFLPELMSTSPNFCARDDREIISWGS